MKTKTKKITDRVKSYEDACKELGIESMNFDGLTKDEIAYRKLKVIAKALRGGRFPDIEKEEWVYYPVFFVYSKTELDSMSEKEIQEKQITRFGGLANYGAHACWRYAITTNRFSFACATHGFRLCVFSREDAKYFGRQFIDIWGEYLFSNE